MRNYISILFREDTLNWDDGMGGQGSVVSDGAAGNPVDLEINMDQNDQITINANDPTHVLTWTIVKGPTVPAYLLLDKTNVITFCNYLSSFLYLFVSNPAFQNFPQMSWLKAKDPAEGDELAPRKGWKDANGTLRKPPPSESTNKRNFSGVPALLEAFQALSAYAASLKASGRLRDAGIVQYAVNQVQAQKWTITEAFDYLRRNRLI